MKNKIVISYFILLSVPSVYAQIPNAGFEDWSTVTKEGITYQNVTNWYTPNAQNSFFGEPEMAEQTTDAHAGSSALKLSNYANKNNIVASAFPMAETGKDEFIDRFPVSGKITALRGFYKYDYTEAHDSCSISVIVFRNGNMIGFGEFIGSSKVQTYAPFTAIIQYFQDSMPDSASINIYTSRESLHVGSVLTIDELSLLGSATGVKEDAYNSVTASVYPNPVYEMANVEFVQQQPGTTRIAIYNLLGVEVAVLARDETYTAGTHRIHWNTANLPEGMYFVNITQSASEKTIKVLLK